MSYHHTLEAAIESLHEIEDLIKGFPPDQKIPAIEIDLAMQKLRSLYELLLMMKDNDGQEMSENVITASVPAEEPVKMVEESKKTTVTITSSVEEVKTVRDDENDQVIAKAEKTVTSHKKEVEVKTLADQFKGGPTLLESLSQTYKRENEDFPRAKPISDLMSAIALNERFIFIRELFNNDKKSFESAITWLNNAGSYESACEYVEQYKWDMEDDAVQLLMSILRRKYIA